MLILHICYQTGYCASSVQNARELLLTGSVMGNPPKAPISWPHSTLEDIENQMKLNVFNTTEANSLNRACPTVRSVYFLSYEQKNDEIAEMMESRHGGALV